MKDRIFLFLPKVCYGGQERVVSRLTEILEDEFDVYVVVLDDTEIVYPINAPIITVGSKKLYVSSRKRRLYGLLKAASFLANELSNKNCRICISFGRQADIVNIVSRLFRKRISTPKGEMKTIRHITSIRGYATAQNIVSSRPLSFLYSFFDNIVCVSKYIQQYLEENLKIDRKKILTIYNPYECDEICKLSIENVKKDEDKFYIVSVGTLKWEKGYWHLLKAFKLSREKRDRLFLEIVGDDYNNNKLRLIDLAERLGIEDSVKFIEWKSNPYAYIGSADLFVLSSVSEGFPNALVEAMACGKAVIAADCMTGPREILSEKDEIVESVSLSDYGVLVPALDIEEDYSDCISTGDRLLAEAIDRMVNDDGLRCKYESLSKKRASEFTYDRCREEYGKLLKVDA